MNTVVMFFSVRTKKLPFRILQVGAGGGTAANGFLLKTSFGLAAERLSCALHRVPHYGKPMNA